MKSPDTPQIVLVGAGRVGLALARALRAAGVEPAVAVRNPAPAAARDATFRYLPLEAVNPDAELVIVAVSDDAVAEVTARLAPIAGPQTTVCHTSGALPLEAVDPRIARRGVFYPLRSFVPGDPGELHDTPLLYEANGPEAEETVVRAARMLSGRVLAADSRQRERLHVAAVFANNFTNYLLDCSARLMREAGLPFGLLEPLVTQAVQRVMTASEPPSAFQTGPAARGDRRTLEKHRALLESDPQLLELYDILTAKILKDHGKL